MIKSLFEILPIYEYEDRIEVSDWVKENQNLGFEGENLVKRFLEKKYDATVTKVDDSYGYDFWVEIENDAFAVEVKTTETCKDTFFMSLNELIKAEKLGAIYKIYRVVKSQDGYIMHILSNSIQLLSIDVGLLKVGYENDYTQINATAFKVSLKEKMLDSITSLKITQEELV